MTISSYLSSKCVLSNLFFFFFRWRQLRFVQACTPFLQIYYIITIFTIYNNTCLVLVYWTWSLCGSEAARRPLLLLLTCGLVVHIMRGSWHQWGRIKTVFFPWCEGEPCASGCDAKAHEKKKIYFWQAGRWRAAYSPLTLYFSLFMRSKPRVPSGTVRPYPDMNEYHVSCDGSIFFLQSATLQPFLHSQHFV